MPLPTTSNTTSPRSQGLHARIGSTYYRLVSLQDAAPAIETAPLQPPRIDTSANPEDIRPEFGTLYSLSDFTGGEGLDFAHRTNPTPRDATRYWDSEGINVSRVTPGEAQSIKLSNRVQEDVVAHFEQHATTSMAYFDNSLFVMDNTNIRLKRYDNLTQLPTLSLSANEDPQVGVGTGLGGMVVHGDDLYVGVLGDGVNSRNEAGTWSTFSDKTNVDKLWSVKGRIIGAAGTQNNELYEVRAGIDSNCVLLHTLEVGNRWTDVEESGAYVVAAANDGYLYVFGFDETSAALTIAARHRITLGSVHGVAAVPGSPIIYIAYVENGAIKVLQAQLDGDGNLQGGRIILEEPAGSSPLSISDKPLPMQARDNAMFILMPDGWLWKHDLVTDGRHKHLSFDGSELRWTWTTLFNLAGLWWAYRNESGGSDGGVNRELGSFTSSYRETTGYLISPLIDHFSAADKSWAGITVDHDTVPSGCSIVVSYSTDPDAITNPSHGSWTTIKTITAGQTDTEETSIGVQSRYLTVKVVLNGNGTNTPIFRSFSTRAFPGPGDIILTLPINTSDQVEMPGRQRLLIPNLGDLVYESLRNIEGTSVTAELLDPSETIVGVVEEVSSRLMLPTARGSETLTTIVRIRGRRTS